jgi:hypothetical protein
MVKFLLMMPAEMRDAVHGAAARVDRSAASWVRQAISEKLEREAGS